MKRTITMVLLVVAIGCNTTTPLEQSIINTMEVQAIKNNAEADFDNFFIKPIKATEDSTLFTIDYDMTVHHNGAQKTTRMESEQWLYLEGDQVVGQGKLEKLSLNIGGSRINLLN